MTTHRGEFRTEADRAAPPTDLTRTLLTEAREELVKADNRAELTLATLGAALTALLGAIAAGVIAPTQYAVIPQLLVWSGCAACAPSLVLLGLAARPRPAPARDLSSPEALSRTAWIKYRCIRRGMAWGAVFLTLTLAGTLAGALT
ncbi:hypothetical protein [Streptomyces violaceus]|uniref:Pycsar effector protein domain-containing protein n=1 Tax=Streptomyces violaceus TaxID=1936 RepID=A0ABY9U8S7_STRVL|nr:hypothetical protein [Streptomyces janthinus]WND19293.1 hypothetical protein RI060_18915 [Streptomyces janthinus]GGS61858.1 hypothetical protein GCM10010270_36240 [Streptomyces janthinus]